MTAVTGLAEELGRAAVVLADAFASYVKRPELGAARQLSTIAIEPCCTVGGEVGLPTLMHEHRGDASTAKRQQHDESGDHPLPSATARGDSRAGCGWKHPWLASTGEAGLAGVGYEAGLTTVGCKTGLTTVGCKTGLTAVGCEAGLAATGEAGLAAIGAVE